MKTNIIDYIVYDMRERQYTVFFKGSRKGTKLYVDPENGDYMEERYSRFIEEHDKYTDKYSGMIWWA